MSAVQHSKVSYLRHRHRRHHRSNLQTGFAADVVAAADAADVVAAVAVVVA